MEIFECKFHQHIPESYKYPPLPQPSSMPYPIYRGTRPIKHCQLKGSQTSPMQTLPPPPPTHTLPLCYTLNIKQVHVPQCGGHDLTLCCQFYFWSMCTHAVGWRLPCSSNLNLHSPFSKLVGGGYVGEIVQVKVSTGGQGIHTHSTLSPLHPAGQWECRTTISS